MIPEANIVQKMEQLIELLNNLKHEYYNLNKSGVEDKVYDQIFQELKDLEKEYNLILPNSPTFKVGHEEKKGGFSLIKHEIPMLSLDSVDDYEKLKEFDQRIKKKLKIDKVDYFCELKIDGLSASLIYKRGGVERIVTRGNGCKGENVTFNKN